MSLDVLGVGALLAVAAEWLALGWLSGIGLPALHSGRIGARWPEHVTAWALRLLVGAFLVGLAQLLLAIVGISFKLVPLVLLISAIGAVGIRLTGRTIEGPSCQTSSAGPRPAVAVFEAREQIGWLMLLAVLGAALLRALLVPESGWDAYSHWGLRAQAFATAGTIVNAHSEHEYYPPLVPLLEAWLYLHRGQISIDLGKNLWALIGGAFGLLLAWHLRLSLPARATPLAPLLATGIVLVTPQLLDGFWTGQADLALTAYLCLTTLAVWQWHCQPAAARAWLMQAAIFGAAAALTKFEGAPRVGLLGLALLVEATLVKSSRRTLPALLCLLIPAAAAWLLWTVFQLGHGIPANAEHLGSFQPLALGGVLVALLGVFAGVRTGGGVLVAIAAWLLSARTLITPPLRFLALVVLIQGFGTLLAFLVSATSPELEVQTSATRLAEQFLPIALVAGAVGLARAGHL